MALVMDQSCSILPLRSAKSCKFAVVVGKMHPFRQTQIEVSKFASCKCSDNYNGFVCGRVRQQVVCKHDTLICGYWLIDCTNQGIIGLTNVRVGCERFKNKANSHHWQTISFKFFVVGKSFQVGSKGEKIWLDSA